MVPIEHFRFLDQVAGMYEAGVASLNRTVRNDVMQYSWQALACFLGGLCPRTAGGVARLRVGS